MTTLNDLSEPWAVGDLAACDSDTATGPHAERYMRDGWTVLPETVPNDLIDRYAEEWLEYAAPDGWPDPIPYRRHIALLDLCSWEPLHRAMNDLIGEPCGLHLNLTGWRSTTRNWHQDGYLNPDTNRDHYIAVWIALDDIHPDSGPFQYVTGSHRWPWTVRNRRMLTALTPDEARSPLWPTHSERILTPLFEAELETRDATIGTWTPKRGQVLLWHPRLLHRGSTPTNPTLERRALIAHYSGIHHRPDMPAAISHGSGWQFPL
jgi:hypothetical protein